MPGMEQHLYGNFRQSRTVPPNSEIVATSSREDEGFMSLLATWPARIVVAAIILLLATAAAWWFFIREDNQLATAPQDFRETPAAEASNTPSASVEPSATRDEAGSTAPGVTASDGYELFVIVAEHPAVDGQTEAAYFAGEQLARLGVPSTAKGTTVDVSGQFSLGAEGLDPAVPATIRVGLATLTSDEGRRDNRVREALQVSQHPTATFTAERIEGWSGIADGESVVATLVGTLELRGVQRQVSWELEAVRQGNVISALATTSFLYEDFGIPLLNIGGVVSVEEDVTLQVQLIAEAAG